MRRPGNDSRPVRRREPEDSIPFFLLILLFLLSGCSAGEGGHRVLRFERDGIPVVRTEGAPKYEGPLFGPTQDLVLGVDEGDPEWQQFGSVFDLLVAPDGRMVLSDSRRTELFIVSPEGELLHRFGREGSGPGEFRNLWLMHWYEPGEEFWVEDQDLFRITRFDLEGLFLGTVNYTHIRMRNTFLNRLRKDHWLGWTGEREGNRNITVYEFLDADLQVVRPFLTLPASPSYPISANAYIPIPFTRGEGIRVGPNGEIVDWEPNQGWICRYDPDGTLLYQIEREWEFPPVTAAEEDSLRRRYRESRTESYRRIADEIPIPDRKPAFWGVLVDDTGRIWVERYASGRYALQADERVVYDVFDREGVWIGIQSFDFRPTLIMYGHAYHSGTSEAGGPRLYRHRLVPRYPVPGSDSRVTP